MADPLSVAASIIGILGAAGQVVEWLAPVVSAIKDTPKLAPPVYSEVVNVRLILSVLQNLIPNLATMSRRRTDLISVDQLIAILTDGVLIFSELEALAPTLSTPVSQIPLITRLQWARKEGDLTVIVARLQSFKLSVSLILNIFQCESDSVAAETQSELSVSVTSLLKSNKDLSRRLASLENSFDNGSILSRRHSAFASEADDEADGSNAPGAASSGWTITERRPKSTISPLEPIAESEPSTFTFETDLQSSRVYRNAKRDTCDFSFTSSVARSNAWSAISGLSVGNVSIISVIALPIYAADISNPQHYNFGSSVAGDSSPARSTPRGKSLYQDCLVLKARLLNIEGFEDLFLDVSSNFPDENPVSTLRAGLRLRSALFLIHNTLSLRNQTGPVPLQAHWDLKAAVYTFLKFCINQLQIPPAACAVISNLSSDDILEFRKIVRFVGKVFDDHLPGSTISAHDEALIIKPLWRRELRTVTQLISEDFIADETEYSAQLENLLEIKVKLENAGNLRFDWIIQSFVSAAGLADAQQHFLVAAEMTMNQPTEARNWGSLFLVHTSIFRSHKEFLVSNKVAGEATAAKTDWPDDGEAEALLTEALRMFAIPSQRFAKYGTFLEEILDHCQLGSYREADLIKAIDLLNATSAEIEHAFKLEETRRLVDDLASRVKDWKGLQVQNFGKLLMFDIVKVTPPWKDALEREVCI
ncbi:uncharacterized protein BCR38DRAFT_9196 [Pseudomassariella vexata]|uniref:Cdc24/Scd1 N-terminal domain-containing protein n=1 Tax=Pseudomassariella vexata TaxID=1141098 RepID=A0A1Y2EJ87_9PEZI|nr:uncharacterized protein BCR38DRAFT_9196 [Pseudomassariella vexata]ORY71384.1 hypothetical protein BCR38DRAFT_9196 [Pseudomassariella vexata]